MRITFNNSALLRRAFEAIKEALPLVRIQIENDGMTCRGMDGAHVSLLLLHISNQDCIYEDFTESFTITINTNLFCRILSLSTSVDLITLTIEQDSDTMEIKFENNDRKSEYEISLLDLDQEELEIPDVDYSITLHTPSVEFHNTLKEISIFGDDASFGASEEGFVVSAEGTNGKGKQLLKSTESRTLEMAEDSETTLKFPLKYLLMMMKGGSPLSDRFTLDMDSQYPLRLVWSFGKASVFKTYLAPKMSDD